MIRGFFARMEQLNSYLPLLPCLKDSDQATSSTARMNVSFSEHKLAIIILRCMPKVFDDQYRLLTNLIPTALSQLRTKLEAICRACEGTKLLKHRAETVANGQDAKKKPFKPAGSSQPKKDKKSWGKSREYSKKFCKGCNEHGGAETTHDTKDCKKYDTKGDRMVSFGRPNKNGGNRRNVRPHGNFDKKSFAQSLFG